GLKVPAIVDEPGGRVVLPVKEGTALTALAPTFTLSPGATIAPASGTARDLSRPVTYTATGADGKTRTWTVEAQVMRSPVLPGLYADPNIAVFGDTYYLYPTTDGFPGWSGTQFHAFSSSDLVHWTDRGVVLDLGPDVSWADARAWAPTIAARNGKYYFYFCADAQLGVAVADSPAGPFKDALGKPLVAAGAYPGQMIDPDVFTDTDGTSYLYWGNGNAYVVPLNPDMVSFDPAKVRTITPAGYNEGSFVFRRKGTYYFSWSENDTRDENYRVAYATGPTPTGPWTKRGVILSKDLSLGIKGTGHHSVLQVPGTDDWYIAYHRFAVPGGDGTHRETTVDRLEFADDGTIKAVVPTLTSVPPEIVPDLTPPVTHAVVTPAAPASGWYRGAVQVAVTATDDRDGAVVPEVRVTGPGFGADWQPLTGPLGLTADGEYTVQFRATDRIGNTAPVQSVTVRIDATAPVTQAAFDAAARRVTLTGTDPTSGLAGIQYSLDGGTTWTAYTAPVPVGATATTVTYRGTDRAGNVEVANQLEVPAAGPDRAPVTLTATAEPAQITYRDAGTVRVTVVGNLGGATAQGSIRVFDADVLVGIGRLDRKGTATITLDRTIPPGRRSLHVTYSGERRYLPAQTRLALLVVRAPSTTTVTVPETTVPVGQPVVAEVRVTSAPGVAVQGTVEVRRYDGGGGWWSFTAQLDANGVAHVPVGRAERPGTFSLRAFYPGSDTVVSSISGNVRITVPTPKG
ncbi:MAG TPA: family 43 glycosylhydrolase, partial [Kineosporiaceae bacterium]